jgi:hypothetical protein
VQNNDDSGPGSLRNVVFNAGTGDVVVFKPGFADHPLFNSGMEIPITVNLTIRGNGVGTTTVDANGFGRIFSVYASNSLTLEDLTVTQGQAPSGNFNGGGVGLGGSGEDGGAIIAATGSTLSLTRVAIKDSRAGGAGDGTNTGGLGGDGGAIYSAGATTITDSTISGNEAGKGGHGGIDGRSGGLGGGVFVASPGNLTLVRSTLTDNDAGGGGTGGATGTGGDGGGGGAVFAQGGSFNSENSTVFNNRSGTGATGGGGGPVGDGEDGHGGGINDSSSSPGTLINTTLTDNSSGAETGGGLFGGGPAAITVRNSIIADNLGAPGDENCDGMISDGANNIEFPFGGGCPNSFGTGNPQLAASLAGNGGPTQTLAPGAGSAALDAVPTGACTNIVSGPLSTDQRGLPRPSGTSCDIGAFEVQVPAAPPAASPPAATKKKCKKGHKRKKVHGKIKCVKKKRKR